MALLRLHVCARAAPRPDSPLLRLQAVLRVLHARKERTVSVRLRSPRRLVPVHINNAPPSYFIVGGLVFTPATVPLLRSEYGKVGRAGQGREAGDRGRWGVGRGGKGVRRGYVVQLAAGRVVWEPPPQGAILARRHPHCPEQPAHVHL